MDDYLPPGWRDLISSSPNQDLPTLEDEDFPHSQQSPLPCGQSLSVVEPSADPEVSDACRSVNISSDQYEELLSRLSKLEVSVASLFSERSTPARSSKAAGASGSAGKGKTSERDGRSSELHEVVLADFQRVCLGGRTGARNVDNARQARSHAKRFCSYMLGGLASPAGRLDLLFLDNKEKLCGYPKHLEDQGYAATTVKHMLCNVSKFLLHVHTNHLTSSRLAEEQLSALVRELKTLQAGVSKKAAVHRDRVAGKVKAEDARLTSAVDADFQEVARRRIPEILGYVKKRRGGVRFHNLLMGYVLGHLAVTTGRRPEVLTWATKEDVACAEVFADGTGFRILVDEQGEADGAGGPASFQLNREEYGWLDRLTRTPCCSGTSSCSFLFHSVHGARLCRPGSVLQEAWLDAGLKGAASFSGPQATFSGPQATFSGPQATSTDADAGPPAAPGSSHDPADEEDAPESRSGSGAEDRAGWVGEPLLSNAGDVSQDLLLLPSRSLPADSSSSDFEDESSFTLKRKSVYCTDGERSGTKKLNKSGQETIGTRIQNTAAHRVSTKPPPLSSQRQVPASSSAGSRGGAALSGFQNRATSANPAGVYGFGATGVGPLVGKKESAAAAGNRRPSSFSGRSKSPPATAGQKEMAAEAGKRRPPSSSGRRNSPPATAGQKEMAAEAGKRNPSCFSGWQKRSGPSGRPNWVRVLPPFPAKPSDSDSE